mmetsp:Transcript_30324/g.45926  ORF Transcript_30324/g.45926 Transcript_30324/m.45926 type:complete len:89 (-) Transcript_30324:1764-2030(-)
MVHDEEEFLLNYFGQNTFKTREIECCTLFSSCDYFLRLCCINIGSTNLMEGMLFCSMCCCRSKPFISLKDSLLFSFDRYHTKQENCDT